MNIVGQSTNGDEEEVRTGRLGGHTREREGLNYLVYEAVYSASCPLVQVACPFITLTPSRRQEICPMAHSLQCNSSRGIFPFDYLHTHLSIMLFSKALNSINLLLY